jgi:O-acetyl-ADP-ribose deacetylase (regulator of RNase III)
VVEWRKRENKKNEKWQKARRFVDLGKIKFSDLRLILAAVKSQQRLCLTMSSNGSSVSSLFRCRFLVSCILPFLYRPKMASALSILAKYRLSPQLCLSIARGSVLDYAHSNGAIVNAANEECLGGGGVDGAITAAGGENLHKDRLALKVGANRVRCPTGQARLTGPNDYDELSVNHVIHAVGPAYFAYDTPQEGDALLASAYRSSLDCAHQAKLEGVAFSLLSAGIYRGSQSREHVLRIGMESICDWVAMKKEEELTLNDIVMCGFNAAEVDTLVVIAEDMKLVGEVYAERPTSPVSDDTEDEMKVSPVQDDDSKEDLTEKMKSAEEVEPEPPTAASDKADTSAEAGRSPEPEVETKKPRVEEKME